MGTHSYKEEKTSLILFLPKVRNNWMKNSNSELQKNHLSGLRKAYLKISFDTVQQLMNVRRDLMHVVERNQAKFDAAEAYESLLTGKSKQRLQDYIECIVDLREYDVPYHVRFAIDNDVRCGQWYDVSVSSAGVMLERRTDLLQRAEVHVCAFDIETTKLPLKFPDAEYDSIMMISYMVDGQGYLIINRECVGEDIEDLEYTPKPEFEGCFKVTNMKNEEELLRQWFTHMREMKPGIYVTYNGDFFDWPFLESRAAHHGLRMSDELGFHCDMNQGECRAKFACHLDCFAWVKRDSYLPQGSQGLKYNYGGIQARINDKSLEGISEPEDRSVHDESQVDIVSSWNIAENLSKATQDHFILIVSEFMYIPWKYAQEQTVTRTSLRDGNLCTPSVTAAAAETFESHMTEYLREQISSYFADKLLRIVRDTILHMKGTSKSDADQHISDGNPLINNIHMGDPALEFIKHVCAVLALDQNVQHDILIMRKNLLKYVRVREFAPEAEFHDQCLSFTLPNVICSYCNDCRDLDLCRDRALLAQEWRCAMPQCGQPYDREVMENALLQIVRQRERLYHLQDLVCLKCNQVKAAHLAEHCACAGSFRCKEDVSEFRNKMLAFLNIAIHQKFQLLQECTSWILEIK